MKNSWVICLCLGLMGIINRAVAQDEYNTIKDITYYGDSIQQDAYMKSRCKLDIYAPKGKKNFPTVVWFHGGGITGGSKYIPEELMNKGVAVVAVNYRLSPKAKAPSYIEDAAAAVAWTFKHIAEYGGSDSLIYVSGHSAGGYLTMMVGFNKSYLSRFGVDANRIAGLIPFSGQTPTHFTIMAEQGLTDEDVRIDEYAPLYWIRPDLPPTLIITGDRELELRGRYEENALLWRKLQVAGDKNVQLHELGGFSHGEMVHPAAFLLLDFMKQKR